MPTHVNGRALGVAQNGAFNTRNTDPIPGGRLWPEAAAAWNDMRAYIGKRHGVWIEPNGPNSSARGREAQDFFWSHQPPPAARPYTSNHGWAIAVDVRTPAMAFYIRKYGHKFGWSWDEGQRVGEWWHFRYVGGYKPRRRRNPRRFLTPYERRHLNRLEDERKIARRAGGWHRVDDSHRRRAATSKRWLAQRRREIWRDAERERHGWRKRHRKERYDLLHKATR